MELDSNLVDRKECNNKKRNSDLVHFWTSSTSNAWCLGSFVLYSAEYNSQDPSTIVSNSNKQIRLYSSGSLEWTILYQYIDVTRKRADQIRSNLLHKKYMEWSISKTGIYLGVSPRWFKRKPITVLVPSQFCSVTIWGHRQCSRAVLLHARSSCL